MRVYEICGLDMYTHSSGGLSTQSIQRLDSNCIIIVFNVRSQTLSSTHSANRSLKVLVIVELRGLVVSHKPG